MEDIGVKDFESWVYLVHVHPNYSRHDRWHLDDSKPLVMADEIGSKE